MAARIERQRLAVGGGSLGRLPAQAGNARPARTDGRRPRRQLRRSRQAVRRGGSRRRMAIWARRRKYSRPFAATRRQPVEQGGRLDEAVALVVLDRLLKSRLMSSAEGEAFRRLPSATGAAECQHLSDIVPRLNPQRRAPADDGRHSRPRIQASPGRAIPGNRDGHHAACCNSLHMFREAEVGGSLQ